MSFYQFISKILCWLRQTHQSLIELINRTLSVIYIFFSTLCSLKVILVLLMAC